MNKDHIIAIDIIRNIETGSTAPLLAWQVRESFVTYFSAIEDHFDAETFRNECGDIAKQYEPVIILPLPEAVITPAIARAAVSSYAHKDRYWTCHCTACVAKREHLRNEFANDYWLEALKEYNRIG